MAEKSNSIWFWIGGGCLALLVLMAIGIAGIGYFGYSQVQRVKTEMTDPSLRHDRAAELLGLEELPEGYEATIAFSVSRFFKTVILTSSFDQDDGAVAIEQDGTPDGSAFENAGDAGNDVLLYLQTPGRQNEQVLAYFRGDTDDPRVLQNQGVQMRLEDPADRGEIEGKTARILWVTHYGDLNIDASDFAGLEEALAQAEREETGADTAEGQTEEEERRASRRRRHSGFQRHGEGTTTLFTPMCEDRRSRIGFWVGPHPIPSREEGTREPPTPAELLGSTGDPAEIEAFLREMDFCS